MIGRAQRINGQPRQLFAGDGLAGGEEEEGDGEIEEGAHGREDYDRHGSRRWVVAEARW